MLFTTAESDSRVDPMHARKMAAAMQAATASEHPILLRVETKAGHGAGKPMSKLVDELTDVYSFLVRRARRREVTRELLRALRFALSRTNAA